MHFEVIARCGRARRGRLTLARGSVETPVFILGPLRKVHEEGVAFASPVDGDRLMLTPEVSIEIQRAFDSDVAMVFDECTPYPASRDETAQSMELSLRWAARCKIAHAGNA